MHLGTTLICHRGTDQREPSAATPTAASQQPAVGRSRRAPAAEAAGRKASRPYSPPPPRPAHVRRAVGEDAQVHRHVRLQVQESQRARPQLVEAELEQVRAPAVGGRPAATGPPPPQPGRRLRHSACLWELVRSRPAGPPVSALENQLVERPAPVLADSDKPSALPTLDVNLLQPGLSAAQCTGVTCDRPSSWMITHSNIVRHVADPCENRGKVMKLGFIAHMQPRSYKTGIHWQT